MNPYVLIAWAVSIAASGWFFYGVGVDSEAVGQAKISQAIADTEKAAQQGAASAIAALKPVNQTIVQKVQHEREINTVYRDCKLPDAGLQLANEAITGRPAEPAGGQQLPGANPATR